MRVFSCLEISASKSGVSGAQKKSAQTMGFWTQCVESTKAVQATMAAKAMRATRWRGGGLGVPRS